MVGDLTYVAASLVHHPHSTHHCAVARILRMSRSTVDLRHKGYELPKHKTEAKVCARHAPLSSRVVRLLRVLEAQAQFDGRDAYFTMSNASRDVL